MICLLSSKYYSDFSNNNYISGKKDCVSNNLQFISYYEQQIQLNKYIDYKYANTNIVKRLFNIIKLLNNVVYSISILNELLIQNIKIIDSFLKTFIRILNLNIPSYNYYNETIKLTNFYKNDTNIYSIRLLNISYDKLLETNIITIPLNKLNEIVMFCYNNQTIFETNIDFNNYTHQTMSPIKLSIKYNNIIRYEFDYETSEMEIKDDNFFQHRTYKK